MIACFFAGGANYNLGLQWVFVRLNRFTKTCSDLFSKEVVEGDMRGMFLDSLKCQSHIEPRRRVSNFTRHVAAWWHGSSLHATRNKLFR